LQDGWETIAVNINVTREACLPRKRHESYNKRQFWIESLPCSIFSSERFTAYDAELLFLIIGEICGMLKLGLC
jgi:hypothetical protein